MNFARIGALGLTSIVAKVASKNKKAKKSRRRVDDTFYPTHLPLCKPNLTEATRSVWRGVEN